jgi:hypothetical protein
VLELVGHEVYYLVRDFQSLPFCLEAENGDASLQVRGLDIGDESCLEPRAKAFLQRGNSLRGTVAGDDDLAFGCVEAIEGVEELFLGAFLAGDELYVIHEKDIHLAVFGTEVIRGLVADGIDEVIGKGFRGHIEDAGVPTDREIADGVEQVGLAQADTAVDEEGIEALAGVFGDR